MLQARFPLLYIETYEETRAIQAIQVAVQELRTPRPVWTWSSTRGLIDGEGKPHRGTNDPAAALDVAIRTDESSVFIFRDLHSALGSAQRPPEPTVVRRLRDVAGTFKTGAASRTLILVSPVLQVPPDLEKDLTLVDFPLPDEVEIRVSLDKLIADNLSSRITIDLDESGKEKLVKAALGLTFNEAENAFARAMVNDGKLTVDDVEMVLEEKRQTIRKSGLLEFVNVDVALDDIGGLENLKRWLLKRDGSWLEDAKQYGIPAPKGVLITGVPGCGKSLTAKATAAAWGLPLLRLDIGKVFAGIVGSSEQNMRSSIATAEATAPCVLWIDEIEKGFSGVGGGGDSGTSSRVFGSFLTWMQEKTKPVFVIATANNIDSLPAEFLRKGRFDEIFFVDLPTASERESIWKVQLDRCLAKSASKVDLDQGPALLELLADASEDYSGAEIEQAIVAGLFDAYSERRMLTVKDLLRALEHMVPLAITQAEQIQSVRRWASVRAVSATSSTARDDRPSDPAAPSDAADNRGGRAIDF